MLRVNGPHPTPAGLSAEPITGGARLRWDAATDGRTTGYLVLRAAQGEEDVWQQLGGYPAAPADGTGFTDLSVETPGAYVYRLVALARSGAESAPAEVRLSVTAAPALGVYLPLVVKK